MEIPGRAGKKRRGMTAIIVEFVLVVVSLMASVMLGGFVFGAISIYVPPAEVAAQVTGCITTRNVTGCSLTLVNQGSKNVSTDGTCSLSVAGGETSGNVTNGGVVPAGGSLQGVQCQVHSSPLPAGGRVSGSLALNNGASVFFTGTAQ